MSFRARLRILIAIAAAAFVALLFVPPFAQDVGYHDFADQRTRWTVPHALNVLSNLPFVIFGLWGLIDLRRASRQPGARDARRNDHDAASDPSDAGPTLAAQWWAFLLMFLFVTLTGFGSMYYHAQPTNDTLYWDRLPLTVVFMAFFWLVLADRVGAGPWLLVALVLAGVGSVTYWHWTEQAGAGDVRFYAFVQFFPILVIPFLLACFPARRCRTQDLLAILMWYLLAKLLEWLDRQVYRASGLVSGHTLKHLAASLGALWLWVLMRRSRWRAEGDQPLKGRL